MSDQSDVPFGKTIIFLAPAISSLRQWYEA